MARKYIQGRFTPKFPEKYVGDVKNIVYRSSWERKMMSYLDNESNIIMWNSEEIVIPYYSRMDDKTRRYFVDFIATAIMPDGSKKTFLIELKPDAQTKPPKTKGRKKLDVLAEEVYTWNVNCDKWESAKKWCAERGIEFVVMTEYDIGIKSR